MDGEAVDPLGSSTTTAAVDCDVRKAKRRRRLGKFTLWTCRRKEEELEDYQSEKRKRERESRKREKKKEKRDTNRDAKGQRPGEIERQLVSSVPVLFENSMQIKSAAERGWDAGIENENSSTSGSIEYRMEGRKRTIPPREYI